MAVFEIIKGSGGGGSGYTTVEGNGVAAPQETTINFVGPVTVTDDPVNGRTNVTITAGGNYQTIEQQGTAKPQEAALNFLSSIFTATDNPGNGSTDITTGLTTYTAGSVVYIGTGGTSLAQDNANFTWTDSTYTLNVTQPSSLLTLESVLVVTSDPSGSHGHGNHIEIAGNPNGGGTIFRTGAVPNDSWIQITGGGYDCKGGGTIYVNGNVASESGAEGCVQTTFGLSTSSFQMFDYTQSTLLFQLNNAGVLQLPLLAPNSYIGTDASSNIVVKSAPTGFTWVVVTTDTVMSANTGYIINGSVALTMTLPSTFAAGAEIRIVGYAGGWTVAQNSGQSIQCGNISTTFGAGGSIASTSDFDCLDIVSVNANTTFVMADSTGNINVT